MLPNNQSSQTRLVITKPEPSHKRLPIAAIMIGVFLTVIPGSIAISITRPKGSIRGVTTTLTPSEIISVTNAARQTAGVPPVHPASELMRAAEAKAKAMVAANSWSHDTPSETPWQFIAGAGYQYTIAGENLARNYDSAAEVVTAWLASPSHKDNLLNPQYTDTGVAVEVGDFPGKPNSVLVVQYFATKYDPAAANLTSTDYHEAPLLTAPLSITVSPVKIILVIIGVVSIFTLGIFAKKIHHQQRLKKELPSLSHWHK